VPIACLSLLVSFVWYDPAIDRRHVKPLVSVGQLMLFLWPIGTYLVAASAVRDRAWVERLSRTVLILALPQVVVLLWPEGARWLSWSWYFGLIAAPLAFARLYFAPSLALKAFYLLVTLLPLIQGVSIGKAFLYGYVMVVVSVVLFFRARALLLVLLPLALSAYLLLVMLPGRGLLPGFVERLVDTERQQASWGGRAGRIGLAADTIAIWSRFPILGVGPGNSYPYMIEYSVIGTPHNQYLNILLELGIVGFAIFLGFVASTIRFGLRLLRDVRGRPVEPFVLGWLAAFCGMAAGGLTGDFLLPSVRNTGLELFSGFYLHWVLLGTAVAVARMEAAASRVEPVELAARRAREPIMALSYWS
jgi:O-antigen ligase